MRVAERTRRAGELKKVGDIAAELLGNLAVEIDELRAARLVPGCLDFRNQQARRRRFGPAHQIPNQLDAGLRAAAQQALLAHRRRRRQRKDHAAKPARRILLASAAAHLRIVDQRQGLNQDFGDQKREKRRPRITQTRRRLLQLGLVGRISEPFVESPFVAQLPQHVAAKIHESSRGAIDGRWLAPGAVIAGLEAPFLVDRLDVAKIALRTRHATGAFRAGALLTATRGFRTDPNQARPEEGARAGRKPRQLLVAEIGLGKLNVAFERLAVSPVRLLKIAQLKDIGIAEIDLFLVREILDQHAAGAAVSDVEHQIDVHRSHRRFARKGVDQLNPGQRHDFAQQLNEGDIARGVFERLAVVGPHAAAAALRGLEFHQEFVDPAVDPLLLIDLLAATDGAPVRQEPGDVAKQMGEREFLFPDCVHRARRHIGALRPALQQIGVKGKYRPVRNTGSRAFFNGRHLDAAPIGRPLMKQIAAQRVTARLHRKVRHRDPFIEERLERPRLRDVVLVVGAAGGKRRIGVDIIVVPARPEFDRNRAVGGHFGTLVLDKGPREPGSFFEIELIDQELHTRIGNYLDGVVRLARHMQLTPETYFSVETASRFQEPSQSWQRR